MEVRKFEPLTRVEGEGRLLVRVEGGVVEDVFLNIFEPPRFFEGILRGRKYSSVMDITARICGICPVAYQISSVQAIESIFGVEIPPEIEDLRRLLYYGEWMQSHVLHVFFLHLPDFLGVSSIFEINRINPDIVKDALKLKAFSGKLVEIIGGRVSHPVNIKVGGFYRAPEKTEFDTLLKDINQVYETSLKLLDFLAKLDYPDYEVDDMLFVSLIDGENYPILKGDVYSSDGLVISKDEFLDYFQEYEVPHSNAKFCRRRDGKHYIVGPLARFNNSFELLLEETRRLAISYGVTPPVKNPFRSILVRMLETVDCILRTEEKLKKYTWIDNPSVSYQVRPGKGCGVSEAPRGVLWHTYTVDSDGLVQEANIIPPTSQNQFAMEHDIKKVLKGADDSRLQSLSLLAEKLIRNYDPCISCATHFLRIEKLDFDDRK